MKDGVCCRCGLCCYQKERRNGRWVILMNRPCSFLDEKTRLCRVYPQRFEKNPHCLPITPATAFFSPLLPESCGYVQKYRFWRKLCRYPALEFELSDTEYSDS